MATPASLYIHIPFCVRKCPYCGFFSVADAPHLVRPYLEALLRELEGCAPEQPLRTVYIGGGTPTSLAAGDIRFLLAAVGECFGHTPDCEFTVEANPGTLDGEKAAALREGGANRISLGAQSFSETTLRTLGRIHGPDEIERSVDLLRRAGFGNVGLDLIYAVPGQSLRQWEADLAAAVGLGVEHVSAYGLSFDEGTQFERSLREGAMKKARDGVCLRMYEAARERLGAAGFAHYEISNFARPGRESAHNCNYWHNGPYFGAGASATAFVGGERRTNVADIEEYIRLIGLCGKAPAFAERLDPEAFARETAAFNIRYLPGIERRSFLERTGFDLDVLFGQAIAEHVAQGFLEFDGSVLRLTPKALPVADSISASFLTP